VAAALVVAAVAVISGRADAKVGPTLRGGVTIAPNTGNYTPTVASNGTETLVVWEKRHGQNGLADIYGRLTKTDTTETRATSVRISLRAADEYLPDVAWNGSSFLVVWETAVSGHEEIHGRRVSKDGALLGSEIAIATRNASQTTPAVTAGPNGQFLVAWEDDRNFDTTYTDIYARRVTSAGAVLDATNIRVSTDTADFFPGDDTDPDIAWNGQFYLVVYSEFDVTRDVGEITASGVTPAGERDHGGVVGGGTLVIGGDNLDALEPAVAASGKLFTVIWTEEVANGNTGIDIRGVTRYDATTSAPDSISIASAVGSQTAPAIDFNGQFLAVWVDRRNGINEIWGARIASSGAILDSDGFRLTADGSSNGSPAVTKGRSTAQTYTVAWERNPNTETTSIVASGVDPAPK
jgi:hypothetical protein